MGTRDELAELEEFEKRQGIIGELTEEQKIAQAQRAEKEYQIWKNKVIEKVQLRKEYELETPWDKQSLTGFEQYLEKRGFVNE